ncbi:hypothetical protein WISP_38593 [Willisornis vidua]|uniref:Uncharacterized protein n=1 Tax=Willisornis vidua TaxID=1566151 RepID=A0ABQ9DHU5_9PASS|nr:hypothetical protein WISP_38593 [Willisornis vidua]
MKMIEGLEHLCHGGRLGEFRLFNLEEKKLQKDFIGPFQYLKGSDKRSGEGLFTRTSSDRVQDWRISEGNISTKQSDPEHWKASKSPLNADEEEVDEEGGLITSSPNSTGGGDWEGTEVKLDMSKVVIG